MSQSKIQVVYFDAAGTLFHVKGSVGEVYLRYAEKYGVSSSVELTTKVNQAFKEAFRQAPPPIFAIDEPEKLKQCERLWWFDIVHGVFYRVGMFEGFDEYFDEVFAAFGTAELWEVYPEVPSVLGKLNAQGYELGVISNFDTRFFEIFRGLKLDQFFQSITISSLARAAKPSPKMFQYALDQHAIDPEEAVHIGDSRTEDFDGARQAKLHGILIEREKVGLSDGENIVHSLDEVVGVLSQFPA
jgi:putative hydrolase of the HAD superfamily